MYVHFSMDVSVAIGSRELPKTRGISLFQVSVRKWIKTHFQNTEYNIKHTNESYLDVHDTMVIEEQVDCPP